MKSVLRKIAQSLLLAPALVLGFSAVAPLASAVACPGGGEAASLVECGANSAQGAGTPSDLFGDTGLFKVIVNILLFLVGAVAVIMLILGGIRYVISGGDQNQVTSAKNTILYAVIGIVVALLAYAIVNFVITGLVPS